MFRFLKTTEHTARGRYELQGRAWAHSQHFLGLGQRFFALLTAEGGRWARGSPEPRLGEAKFEQPAEQAKCADRSHREHQKKLAGVYFVHNKATARTPKTDHTIVPRAIRAEHVPGAGRRRGGALKQKPRRSGASRFRAVMQPPRPRSRRPDYVKSAPIGPTSRDLVDFISATPPWACAELNTENVPGPDAPVEVGRGIAHGLIQIKALRRSATSKVGWRCCEQIWRRRGSLALTPLNSDRFEMSYFRSLIFS